jgi:hypothetical protein
MGASQGRWRTERKVVGYARSVWAGYMGAMGVMEQVIGDVESRWEVMQGVEE